MNSERRMVKNEQKKLLRASWIKVLTNSDATAEMFYRKLFELDPGLQPLFGSADMAEQGRKFIQTLSLVINSLNDPEPLIAHLEELGRRHVRYGVLDSHYDTVEAALLWALQQNLGEAWNDELRDAWIDAYQLVAGVMKSAPARGA